MLIDINRINVSDRIRKDFGDIEELASDLKENGLINPPKALEKEGVYRERMKNSNFTTLLKKTNKKITIRDSKDETISKVGI